MQTPLANRTFYLNALSSNQNYLNIAVKEELQTEQIPFQLQKRRFVDAFSNLSLNQSQQNQNEFQTKRNQSVYSGSQNSQNQNIPLQSNCDLNSETQEDLKMETDQIIEVDSDMDHVAQPNKSKLILCEDVDSITNLYKRILKKGSLDVLDEKLSHQRQNFNNKIVATHEKFHRKELIKQFVDYYLHNLIKQNDQLLKEYLRQISQQYNNLKESKQLTFFEIIESLQEMNLNPEENKMMFGMLMQYTNIEDFIMQDI
eukprot:403368752